MTFAAHRFQHSECCQRVDEGRCPILRRCPLGQDKTRGSINRSVLRVHCSASNPDCFPTRAWAAEDDPAATTVPAPSLPTGSGLLTRAESPPSAPAGNDAVTLGRSGVPATVAVDMSAPAMRTPKSDGLIGEASTRPDRVTLRP